MPRYKYECTCGLTKDIDHKVADAPEVECDKCKLKMEKIISVNSLTFKLKGKGFHINDYKKKESL